MKWIIVGLGNPGEDYTKTRHNTGRKAVESFARQCDDVKWKEHSASHAHMTTASYKDTALTLVLPDTFMNKSGNAVVAFVKSIKAAAQLVVVYDDIDLPLGAIKIAFDRGSGGHKGLESIIRALKTKAFVRVRIGVAPTTASGKTKKPSGGDDVIDFILGTFKPKEQEELKAIFKRTDEVIGTIVTDGHIVAMNRFN